MPLLPLKQLRRQAQEIEATHPQYREGLPLVLPYEMSRCRFTSGLVTIVSQMQVAPDTPAQTLADECYDWQPRAVDIFRPSDALVQPILSYCCTTENNRTVCVADNIAAPTPSRARRPHRPGSAANSRAITTGANSPCNKLPSNA